MQRSGHSNALRLSFFIVFIFSICCSARNVLAGPTPSEFVSSTWYTGWHATDFPLSNISWSKYTHIKYAFATTTPNPNLLAFAPSDETNIVSLVTQAHQYGVKASLSIGGWTGSRWFSSNVGSANNRSIFVTTVSNLIRTYGLDGVDFDWEYPGSKGIGCNVFSPNDTGNYLAFLKELRQSPIGSNITISLAVSVTPYLNSSGGVADMTPFSQVVDFIEIMDYDVASSPSAGAGPSSPLNDTCAPPAAQFGSAVSAVKAWTDAGMPFDKIVLGVPAYGHSFAVNPSSEYANDGTGMVTLFPQYNSSVHRTGDTWDNGWGVDVCGNQVGPGGTFTYRGLIAESILNNDGTIHEGISYVYDNCSQTPFAYDPQTQTLISYENPMSFVAKGRFISSSGLKGFSIWEAGGDYHDVLLDAMLSGLQNNSSNTPLASKTHASSGIKQIGDKFLLLLVAYSAGLYALFAFI